MARNTLSNAASIRSHPLAKAVIDNLRWINKGAAPRLAEMITKPGGLRKRGKVASHPPCDIYDRLALQGIGRILTLLDRLGNAQEMVLRFPQRTAWERVGITRDVWIEYHYSYFLISLCSLPDLSSPLVNNIFRLGLLPKHCKLWVIKENGWIRGTAVQKALSAIEKNTGSDQVLRNLHIHEGETPDPADLTDSDLYDLLKITAFAKLHGDLDFSAKLLTAGFRAEAHAISDELYSRIGEGTKAIGHLFDALPPVYLATEQQLHAGPSKGCRRLQ
jgi:hypothetical protein